MRVEYETKNGDYYYRDNSNVTCPLWCGAHLHYHIELAYILEGEVEAYIDLNRYILKKGDLIAIFPNKVHRFEKISEVHKYKLYIINPDICPELSDLFIRSSPKYPVIHNIQDNYRLLRLLECISALDANDRYYNISLRGCISSLFCECLSAFDLYSTQSDEGDAVKMIVNYCSKNFKRELSLATLEEELHLSKYYISHIFSGKLGVRFNDYINSLRISYASRKLISTDLSITKICEISGFSTLRTFNRAFYKQLNTSPSEYRREHLSASISASYLP